MNPLLFLFLIALGVSIILSWLIPYFFTIFRYRVFGRVIVSAMRYFTHLRTDDEPWPRITGETPRTFDRILGWAGVRRFFTEPVWVGIGLVLLFLLFIFVFGAGGIFLTFFSLLLVLAWFFLRARQRQRLFLDAFPQALDVLTRALRAGYSLPQAVTLVSNETYPPVQHVFRALERSSTYRIPLRQTLLALEDELVLPAWDLFAESLLIQERTGGNMIPIVTDVASTIRQNASLEQEMRSATAAGRLSGIVIALLIPCAFVAFYVFNPIYMEIFFTTTIGRVLLSSAALLEIIGFVVIRRITRIHY